MKRLLRLAPWLLSAGLALAWVAVYTLTPSIVLGALALLVAGLGLSLWRG